MGISTENDLLKINKNEMSKHLQYSDKRRREDRSIDLDTLHDKDKGYLSLARLKKFEM